ncbi:ATP-binding protein, partial [Dinoroseobacter sp. S375]|uniref:ATP-binding protein n=1 Tax=Dinoroseobacter sp. S375 TaxID=3415136 RepID=UPI003C7C5E2E
MVFEISKLIGSTDTIDGTPEKRMFLSIIADYDLTTSICELVDNAIDNWTANSKPAGTQVDIFMNADRQKISVVDNAGGVPADQMRLLISPGASREISIEEIIGTFGVGGKRAGVALGERVEIVSRYDSAPATRIVIDNDWLSSEDWEIEAKRVDEGEVGQTIVRISELRQGFDHDAIEELRKHLAATYCSFVESGCNILINGTSIGATRFDHWAYPPDYPPRQSTFSISPDGSGQLEVTLSGGLILD